MNNKEKLILKVKSEEIQKIENFVEEVCDKYNLNDKFFGNIIVSLPEMMKLIIKDNKEKSEEKIKLLFENEQGKIKFKLITKQNLDNLNNQFDKVNEESYLEHTDERSIFLVKTLCDKITFNKNNITLEFDTAKLTKESSKKREQQMQNYFRKEKQRK